METRTVRISGTSHRMTFTQRGRDRNNGFIRVNGMTVTGYAWASISGERVFQPLGRNAEELYIQLGY